MFVVPIWMKHLHAENHQCSQILDYKLKSRQPGKINVEWLDLA